MNSTLVIQCLKNDYKHESNSFFFVMNMFDTNVDVEQGMSVSLTSDDGLGDDMYFWQTGNTKKKINKIILIFVLFFFST